MPLVDLMARATVAVAPPVIVSAHPPILRGRRVQRSRKKGAKTPPGVIYAGRPTDLGNPFRSDRFGHVRSVKLYRRWAEGRMGDLMLERLGFCPSEIEALHRWRVRLIQRLPSLAGHDLQCWCPLASKWCHVDVLLDLVAEYSFEGVVLQ